MSYVGHAQGAAEKSEPDSKLFSKIWGKDKDKRRNVHQKKRNANERRARGSDPNAVFLSMFAEGHFFTSLYLFLNTVLCIRQFGDKFLSYSNSTSLSPVQVSSASERTSPRQCTIYASRFSFGLGENQNFTLVVSVKRDTWTNELFGE